MELWIRSQDRTELFHPTSIWMVKDENSVYCQYGLNKTCIAIYKSEERALEVLDEIQDKIWSLNECPQGTSNIYQMPKE